MSDGILEDGGTTGSGAGQADTAAPRRHDARRARRAIALVFVLAGALAAFLLARRLDLDQVGARLRHAAALPLIAAYGVYLGGLLLLGLRWHTLVCTRKPTARLRHSLDALTASLMINYASPGSVGVPARAILTRQLEGLPFVGLAPLAFSEALLDVAALAILASAALLLAGPDVAGPLVALVAGHRAAIAPALIVAPVVALGIPMLVLWRWRRPAARVVRPAFDAVAAIASRPGTLVTVIALTIAFWLVQVGVIGLLFAALKQPAPLPFILTAATVPLFLGMVAPVPGGVGVREAAMLAIARGSGVEPASVLLVALLYRALLLITNPLIFLSGILRKSADGIG